MLVLSFLVLITVLVVAFFTTVTTELTTAKGSASESTVRQLADSTAQLVMGTIQKATGGDGTTAWASQPGMVRTYDAAGNKLAYYKLYSSDNAVVAQNQINQFDFTRDDLGFAGGPPTAWVNQKAIFTDLNAPVSALDPSASGGTRSIYPIVDPSAMGVVSGFSISTDPAASPVVASGNPIPMPVKWIYVLRDGTMTTPSGVDGTGQKATWSGAASSANVPTAQNPIVGRVAYWTDDDTCKVNINTASEGSYWDMPRTYSVYDYDTLSTYQPFQHEYQRYPGHPATTSLSAVLGSLTQKEDVYKIVPRTTGQGSTDGTVLPGGSNTSPLTIRTDRLYASIDELMFQPNRQQNNANLSSGESLSKSTFETAKFFLTASSRAPDVNLFGKPRVSLWPITLKNGTPAMTSFDKLLAFCSTVSLNSNTSNASKSIYYFQRTDNNSSTTDLPAAASSSSAPLYRNRTLLEYLRTLTSQTVPGFGSSLRAKYQAQPANCDQILTEMFDYIRCTNLRDSSDATKQPNDIQYASGGNDPNNSSPTGGQVVPIVDQDHLAPNGGRLRGFGRYPTVEQGALLFIGTDDNSTHPPNPKATPPDAGVAPGMERVQAAFLPQFFDPSEGFCLYYPWFTYIVKGLDAFKWNNVSMGFPATYIAGWPVNRNVSDVTFYGGSLDPKYMTYYMNNNQMGGNGDPVAISAKTGGANQAADMPLLAPSPSTPSTFHFSGGNVTIEIHPLTQGYTLVNPAVQTITLHFPDGDFPVPTTSPVLSAGPPRWPTNVTSDFKNIYSRFYNDPFPIIGSTDTVRSVIATPGDIRLMAAREVIGSSETANFYAAPAAYGNPSNKYAHTLYTGVGRPWYGAAGGKLVAAPNTYMDYQPQYLVNDILPGNSPTVWSWGGINTAAPHVTTQTGVVQPGGNQVPGDWDNGVANLTDGPYINKADEGSGTYTSGQPYSYFWLQYAGVNTTPGPTFFSPNRLVQSAVEFGSLPSGVWSNQSWQTLLFRPGPALHPGLGTPSAGSDPSSGPYSILPDHLWLDLFHMPVIEPYAISEPLSTAGRINMNYQLAPFTYIKRTTGIYAFLKSDQMLAVPN